MTNPGNLLQRIAENLPNISHDQQSITKWVGNVLEEEDTYSIVEGHNLSIKLQRAFEENIFKSMIEA